jgi:ABC-type dipeptide/oligopeptide/nickel transport system ATPase subunit
MIFLLQKKINRAQKRDKRSRIASKYLEREKENTMMRNRTIQEIFQDQSQSLLAIHQNEMKIDHQAHPRYSENRKERDREEIHSKRVLSENQNPL